MEKSFLLITCLVLTYFGLSESSSINCEYDKSYHFSMRKYYYQCKVLNDPNITSLESAQIESITGNHLKKKNKVYNDNKVSQIKIILQTVNYFPKNLPTFFNNLKSIELDSVHLKEIHQSDLMGLKKLEALDLSNNDLQIIDQGLFDNNWELQYIRLYNNKLIHIDPDVFDNLPKLETLNLIDSGCTLPIYPHRPIQLTIKEIKNRCANLDYLSPEQKAKYYEHEEYKKQQELDFSSRNNTIACVIEKKFGETRSIIKYNLPITTPELAQINSVFEINDKYEATELSPRNDVIIFGATDCSINYFPRGLDKIFTNLQQITIARCELKEIHQADLKPFAALDFLNLAGNLIEIIEDGLFDFNKELSQIYLSNNKIVHIGADAFSNLPRLESLYLLGIPCLDKASYKGCKDAYGLSIVIETLRSHCFYPELQINSTVA